MTPASEKTIQLAVETDEVTTTTAISPPMAHRPLSHLPTPPIPFRGLQLDRPTCTLLQPYYGDSRDSLTASGTYSLYVIFEAKAVRSKKLFSRKVTYDWSPSAARITTITASSNHNPFKESHYRSTTKTDSEFTEMDTEAQALWHHFVEEMQGRIEFEGKMLLMAGFKAFKKDKRFIVKVESVKAPQSSGDVIAELMRPDTNLKAGAFCAADKTFFDNALRPAGTGVGQKK